MSQKLMVEELHPHKKNEIYFDDIEGDAWSEFLESIRTSGVIEPIVVTQDKVIVSGHQRVRACKTLGIEEIEAEVRIIDSEDEVLKQLIETNIRQRGVGNTNPVKFGRCLMELERIYGIQHGGDRKSEEKSNPQDAELKSQEDLASELGMSVDSLNRYKRLAKAIPEIQSLVESGKVTKTVALGIMKRLSEDEQKQLAEMLPKESKKVSSFEIKFYEKRIKDLDQKNEGLKSQIVELEDKIADMESSQPEPEVKEVEVVPDDYEESKLAAKRFKEQAKTNKAAYDELMTKYTKKCNEALELRDQITDLQKVSQEGLEHSNLSENVFYFCTLANNFVGNVGGLVWLTERIADMPKKEQEMFLKAARALRDFSVVFAQNMERNGYGKEHADGINAGVSLLTD